MIKCAFGGPEFVFKALPVSNLTSQFLIEQCNPLIQAITEVENCDETMAALETYSTIHSIDARGTILFLKLIIRFWKIVNVQSPGADIRYKDNDRQVVRSVNDPSLLFLSELAHLVEGMKPENRKTRMHQLTYDTASIMAHTCRALVSLATNMLTSGQSFVILGWFSTDPLENCFSKLRQGAGGTYFISAQSVLEKLNIQRANTALNLELACINEATDGHYCEFCERTPSEEEAEILDNLTVGAKYHHQHKKCNGIHIWLYSTPSWCNRCRWLLLLLRTLRALFKEYKQRRTYHPWWCYCAMGDLLLHIFC